MRAAQVENRLVTSFRSVRARGPPSSVRRNGARIIAGIVEPLSGTRRTRGLAFVYLDGYWPCRRPISATSSDAAHVTFVRTCVGSDNSDSRRYSECSFPANFRTYFFGIISPGRSTEIVTLGVKTSTPRHTHTRGTFERSA